ncbi:ABC transporter ATP-binding protein [Anaerosporobacter sp.]|uniref:ABC transporter ATP-binding protein n=1 Tax=Anaerosporobacter sp. TaxID=1872529 RepID=UPI00286EF111|nr:ABC transporter ATP-binding protein [Anaerosporobacter sp.]
MKPIINVKDLKKHIQQEKHTIPILDSINLEIEENEFVSIMGPSGSGKSTLLGILSGLDNECSGSVEVCDHEILTMKDKQLTEFRNGNIGIIFQSFNLLPDLNILENVKIPLYFSEDKGKMDDRAVELLKEVSLQNRVKNYPKQLSGGEQQRVAIARALVNRPRVLFADEPTGALDKANGQLIIDLIVKIRRITKMTVVMVTHDLDIAKQADRIIHIEDGKIK